MGTIYVDTGGNAANSGCTDVSSPIASGTAATLAGLVLTLDGSPDLSSLIDTPGPTQSTINLAGATNANRTIFWITDFDNGAKTVTVDAAPTGLSSGSISWRIGGQYVWPSGSTANVVEGAIGLSGAQDILQINSIVATRTAVYFTARVAGASTVGWNIIRGKTGSRPKLEMTSGSAAPISLANMANWKVENLELAASGASTANPVIGTAVGANIWLHNLLVSDGPSAGIDVFSTNAKVTDCEVTGVTGDGMTIQSAASHVRGNYIHDNGGGGIQLTGAGAATVVISSNLIKSNAGRGFYASGAVTAQSGTIYLLQNTFVDNTLAGIHFLDGDLPAYIQGNIIKNANAADLCTLASERFIIHSDNVFYSSGGGALGITLGTNETNADPLFINSGSGNFGIQSTSPAIGVAKTLLGLATSSAYRDMGAFQRQVTASGGSYVIGS